MLPIDLLRRRNRHEACNTPHNEQKNASLVLVHTVHQQQVVASCCALARKGGVRAGMSLAQARAVLRPPPRVEPFDPVRTSTTLEALGMWASRFSPRVSIDKPDGLFIDVTGCERVFGGESQLAQRVLRDLVRLGITARCAIAPTFVGAWAIARHGALRCSCVSSQTLRDALAPLPVAALRLDMQTVLGLREVGIERIESLMSLPRSVLPARFGAQLLLRLDQALGQAIETLVPIRPVDLPRTVRRFEGPTSRHDAIEQTARALVREITKHLHTLECGATRLVLTLERSDLPPLDLPLMLSHPTRNEKHLWSLLRPRLERAHLGFGVEAMELVVRRWGRLAHEQTEAWTDREQGGDARSHDRACAQLVDTMVNRLGNSRVRQLSLVESHRPERACQPRPVMIDARTRPTAHCTPHDRPTMLLDCPAVANVVALSPDGPVHHVRRDTREHKIIQSVGPERIASEWWPMRQGGASMHHTTRDYFKVQDDDGRWLWIFRVCETGRWFMHGAWV